MRPAAFELPRGTVRISELDFGCATVFADDRPAIVGADQRRGIGQADDSDAGTGGKILEEGGHVLVSLAFGPFRGTHRSERAQSYLGTGGVLSSIQRECVRR